MMVQAIVDWFMKVLQVFSVHPWMLWVFVIVVPLAIALGLRAGQAKK